MDQAMRVIRNTTLSNRLWMTEQWWWHMGKLLHANIHFTRNAGKAFRGLVGSWCFHRSFFDNVINFLGVAIALYTIAQVYGWASNDAIIKHTVKCRVNRSFKTRAMLITCLGKYCGKRISEKVISPTNISLLEKKSDKELLRPKGA